MTLEYKGYVIVQAGNNHIQLFKDNQMVMHEACNERLSLKEMHQKVDEFVDLINKVNEGQDLNNILTKKLLV